jgi:hypothetical protein
MLASNQPTGNLISGQGGAALAVFTLTGNGTVSSITLNRGGVSDQSTLTNVYLYDGATRLTDGYSFNNNGTLTMNNLNLMVNGSRTVTVRGDVLAGSSVNGQTIAVILSSLTAGTAATTANLMGNTLNIVNGTGLLSTVNLQVTAPSPSAASINAGSMNQNLWSNTISVGLHAASLRGMTVKMIGSAPSNALANVGLFIDGTKVASANINGNMQYVFDLTGTPFALTTGSHNLEIRGDIVGGSYRNFYISLEKASDLMINDSQVSGGTISVTPTYLSGTLNNLNGGVVTIQNGTLTINQDTSFNNVTTLVGGATNVKMAAYKFTAYGEDVKVNSLTFTPTFAAGASSTLINVGLYVNGGQVGSNQTASTTVPITFSNLGSNLIASIGTPVIVEIRGDVVSNANTPVQAGTVKFDLAAGSSNAQGVGSGQLTSTAASGGQTLTISTTNVSFAQTSGFAASTIAPNQVEKKIGTFTVQTGSAEGIVLSNILVGLNSGAGTMLNGNQVTNIKIKDGSTVVGTPVGNPTASNNFSVTIPVAVSTTKTFDVYADIGSSAATLTVIPTMTITYRGATSNVTTISAAVTGATITANVAQILAGGVTFVPSSSAVAQFLVGGQTAFTIGTFNIKSNNSVGGGIIKDVTVYVPANTIGSVTMNGITAQVVGTSSTLYNVGVVVPADAAGVNIPVTVSLNCVGASNGCAGVSNSSVSAEIAGLTYNDGSAIQTIAPTAITATSKLVASKPTVTMVGSSGSGFVNGNQQIGTFTVSADAAGDIKLEALPVAITVSGAATITPSTVELRDATGNTVIVGSGGVNGTTALSGSGTFSFTSPRSITKGTSETYTVWATFTGVTGGSNTMNETFGLGAKASLLWTDVIGGVSGITGAQLNTYPTTTQTKSN